MSRIELDAIQDKLKTAIQNHQMLVKAKGDKQNVAFKSCLTDLQEEIKRLSEEQKKIVVKLRESLVKSTSLPVQPQTSMMSQMLTLDQTVAAIGQSRLVSYPTQGGTTILPVGMVAVPLAHVQRPALGMTFNAGRGGQICTPASITLQPGDYATAVQLPSGIHGNSISIPVNSVNNNNNNIALQNSIAINNITNAINVSSLNGGIVNGSISITGLNNNQSINNLNTIIGSGVAAQPIGNIVIGSKTLAQLNNNNIATTTVSSSVVNTTQGSDTIIHQPTLTTSPSCCITPSNVSILGTFVESITTSSSQSSSVTPTNSNISTIPNVVKSQLPFVQHHLLQQQQQQQQQQQHNLLEMIRLPQPRQQRLTSNFPIKVPHYSASPMRMNASSTNVQFCSIAPAPGPVLPTPAIRLSVSSAPSTTSTTKKLEAVKTVSAAVNNKSMDWKTTAKAESTPQQQHASKKQSAPSPIKSLSGEEENKHKFMKALDLYTPVMLKELLHKRNERKRRTTANPHYSIGFESNRYHRNESIANPYPFKKVKVGKERKPSNESNQSENNNKRDKMSDNHDDFCAACGKGGQLLMCETCRLVYHLDCLKPPLTEAPKYAWSCPKCLVSGKGSANLNSEALSRVHAYIGKRIAKEDKRKKLQRKGAEIRNEKSFLDSRSKKLESEMRDQHNTKKKLEDKEEITKKELDQLSVLVQSVRENHSTITSPSSQVRINLRNEMSSDLPVSSIHVPLSVSINESSCKGNLGVVDSKDMTVSSIESVLGEDRILLQLPVSSAEMCKLESKCYIENGTQLNVTTPGDQLDTSQQSPVLVESVVVSTTVESSSSLSSPSLTVSDVCDDVWKQPIVISENQLSVSS